MSISIQNIVPILKASYHSSIDEAIIEHISIDSRSLQNGKSTLFFALQGSNNDGHTFILELINRGVRTFVVNQIPDEVQQKANFLLVENTVTAFQNFAAYYRTLFHFPVIGITGSNGKTIVKEWLTFLLSPDYSIIRSPKSYNSQVGVPLSVLAINEKHNLGIFEAGISMKNEMENLEKIICPTLGILTNIGTAHDEGFSSKEEKIAEKLKLFANAKVLFYEKNAIVDRLIPTNTTGFSWSFTDKNATVYVVKESVEAGTRLHISYAALTFTVLIPFHDSASVENAITCLLVLLYFGCDIKIIQERMFLLFPIEMRLKVKDGINNTTLIDDSYSSDFQSLKIALDFLESQKQHQKKTIIISDIFQSGLSNEVLYSKVADLLISNSIARVIGIGETISTYKNKFKNCTTYKDTASFMADFDSISFGNETLLVKGARTFEFEKIVTRLEQKTHETVLEINLNAISHNLNYYKSKLKPTTKIMVMVKAFGYGSGGFEIAKLLEHLQVDYLGVAFADEGIALKTAGIRVPIMVLNPENTSFPAIINHQLEPEIYCSKGLKAFLKLAEEKKLVGFPIHIKLDTGMHRLGFEEESIPELLSILKENKSVTIKSILSHMATSDDLSQADFAHYQIELFSKLATRITTELGINPILHLVNTSGISNYPQAQFDMVRLGIGLYGISNSPEEQPLLENVGTLKSVISQIRTIQAGESVGYGRRFMSTRTTKVATLPIGYADGISRHWGNGVGFVLINEQPAPIIGSICMDMMMVDVTEINCDEGDSVIIFGKNPSVIYIAHQLKTIPYEILTSISQRVQRIFFRA